MKTYLITQFLKLKFWFFSFIKVLSNEFGFESFDHMIKQTFFLDFRSNTVYILGLVLTLILNAMDWILRSSDAWYLYMDNNLYNPSMAIVWLFIITLVDLWTGIKKSTATTLVTGPKTPSKMEGNKFQSSFVKFTMQLFFVVFVYNISKIYPELSLGWVVHTLMLAFIFGTFLSAWNNAYLLKYIDKDVYESIKSILDLRKLIFKIKNNNKNQENQDENDQEGSNHSGS